MPPLSFKNYSDAYFLGSLHPRLKEILNFVIHETSKQGWDLIITSTYRDDGGVHSTGPIRGIDLVPVDRDTEKMEWIRGRVNKEFTYGKGDFQVCPDIHHGSAAHNHLQARDSTRRLENANL